LKKPRTDVADSEFTSPAGVNRGKGIVSLRLVDDCIFAHWESIQIFLSLHPGATRVFIKEKLYQKRPEVAFVVFR
jgi:hypothetical protein